MKKILRLICSINPLVWVLIVLFLILSPTCSVWMYSPEYEWRVKVEYTSGTVVTDTIMLPENVTYRQDETCTNFYSLGKNLYGFDAFFPRQCGSIVNTIRVVSMEKIAPAKEHRRDFDCFGVYGKRH